MTILSSPSATVEAIDLFRALPSGDAAAIHARMDITDHAGGVTIVEDTDDSTDIFFILTGSVIARGFSAEGREIIYTCLRAGEMFGEFSAIDKEARSASIHTLEPTTLARMRSSDFRDLVASRPALGLRLAEHLVSKTRELTKRLFEFGLLSVRERLLRELLRLSANGVSDGNSCMIVPAPTHYEIATSIATHREAVSRELSSLAADNIVEVGRKALRICDLARLRALIDASQ